jgi:hypothetical protein
MYVRDISMAVAVDEVPKMHDLDCLCSCHSGHVLFGDIHICRGIAARLHQKHVQLIHMP